jgi:hypothetical protein
MFLRACSILAFLAFFPSASQADGESIVGAWAPDPDNCTPVGGMIAVTPLGLTGDEFRCDFKSVSRSGDVVTWRGKCGFPSPFEPAVAVASLRGSKLNIRINDADNGTYRRCRLVSRLTGRA